MTHSMAEFILLALMPYFSDNML